MLSKRKHFWFNTIRDRHTLNDDTMHENIAINAYFSDLPIGMTIGESAKEHIVELNLQLFLSNCIKVKISKKTNRHTSKFVAWAIIFSSNRLPTTNGISANSSVSHWSFPLCEFITIIRRCAPSAPPPLRGLNWNGTELLLPIKLIANHLKTYITQKWFV